MSTKSTSSKGSARTASSKSKGRERKGNRNGKQPVDSRKLTGEARRQAIFSKKGFVPPSLQHTKIVCTLGPATATKDRIRQLILAGADAIRLNFSHSNYDTHKAMFEMTREAARESGRLITIIQDLQGPKIRIGALPDGPVFLRPAEQITLTTDDVLSGDPRVPVGYKKFAADVEAGNTILIDDGLLALRVDEVKGNDVLCTIIYGGLLKEKKGINLPGTKISEPSLTEKDLEDLEFGLKLGVDYVALSFVRSAQDIIDLKKIIRRKRKSTQVIAKIEKVEAVRELDAVIDAADAVMVARGDLGVEMPGHIVPLLQKRIISRCKNLGKPVITATQMLESMINNPRPTRAEASDVANAVFDGTDGVMLSAETSVGAYPVETVMVMDDIIQATESAIPYADLDDNLAPLPEEQKRYTESAVAAKAAMLATEIRAAAILCLTYSGMTARVMSRRRPGVPIIAIAQDEDVCRRLGLYSGIFALTIDETPSSTEEAVKIMEKAALDAGVIRKGDLVIMTTGYPLDSKASTNMMLVQRI
ncbi:MAG: pyruvate kinase [Candidatus Kapaibacterium sp.]